MNNDDTHPGQASSADLSPRADALGEMHEAKRSIGDAASEASQKIREEAKTLGSEAQAIAEEKAERVKDIAESHLDVFSDALRAASDQLSKNQSGPAAEMVAHAASGLESLSRSLHGKSTGEMIEAVRQFGRNNPIGFLAGSVLAGLALGRFAAAGEPSTAHPAIGDVANREPSSTQASNHNDRGVTQ